MQVVDRGSPEVLKDYVVFLKVIGDAIDVKIINEGAPQCMFTVLSFKFWLVL